MRPLCGGTIHLPLRFFGSFWRCTCFAGDAGRCKRSAGRLQTRQRASTAVNASGKRSAIWIFIPAAIPPSDAAGKEPDAGRRYPSERKQEPAAGSMAGRSVPLRSREEQRRRCACLLTARPVGDCPLCLGKLVGRAELQQLCTGVHIGAVSGRLIERIASVLVAVVAGRTRRAAAGRCEPFPLGT